MSSHGGTKKDLVSRLFSGAFAMTFKKKYAYSLCHDYFTKAGVAQ
jgi:hypothetical protein